MVRLLCIALLVAGCGRKAGPAAPAASEPATAAVVEPMEALRLAACAGAPGPCAITQIWEAGRDDQGRRLVVATIAIEAERAAAGADEDSDGDAGEAAGESGDEESGDEESGASEDTDEEGGDEADDGGESEGMDEEDGAGEGARDTTMLWLGVIDERGPAPRLVEQRLLYTGTPETVHTEDYPQEGYDAYDPLPMRVEDNRLTMHMHDVLRVGWNMNWAAEGDAIMVFRLSPLQLLRWAYHDQRVGAEERRVVDWRTLHAYRHSTRDVCPVRLAGPSEEVRALDVPVMSLPAALRDGGWRQSSLAECALGLSSRTALRKDDTPHETQDVTGFIIHGEPDSEDDATMHVVMGPGRTLYIEIHDDVWVTSASSWLREDHVEIWIGPESEDASCISQARSPALRQWAIQIGSGAVRATYGKGTEQLHVEHVPPQGTAGARLAITLPPEPAGLLTVVYSDSDRGTGQDYLLATSQLRYGMAHTLGSTWNVADVPSCVSDACAKVFHGLGEQWHLTSAQAACEVRGGVLRRKAP